MRIHPNAIIHYKPEQLHNIKEVIKVTFCPRTHTPKFTPYPVEWETEDTLSLEGAWSSVFKLTLGVLNRYTIFILPEDAPAIETLYHRFKLRRLQHELKKLHIHIGEHHEALKRCAE